MPNIEPITTSVLDGVIDFSTETVLLTDRSKLIKTTVLAPMEINMKAIGVTAGEEPISFSVESADQTEFQIPRTHYLYQSQNTDGSTQLTATVYPPEVNKYRHMIFVFRKGLQTASIELSLVPCVPGTQIIRGSNVYEFEQMNDPKDPIILTQIQS